MTLMNALRKVLDNRKIESVATEKLVRGANFDLLNNSSRFNDSVKNDKSRE